jgi:hypothetical protein
LGFRDNPGLHLPELQKGPEVFERLNPFHDGRERWIS